LTVFVITNIVVTMKSMSEELHQTKPFRSLEDEAYLALRLTSRVTEEPWDRHLRKTAGISPSQYNLLRILRGAGAEGRTMSEIRERMINRDPDVTRLADGTVKRGLAHRMRDPGDRRVVKLFITEPGLDLLARLDADVDRYLEDALGGLSDPKLEKLIELLGEIREQMRRFPAGEYAGP
jgi:DNA-binding MarR family transcriptional regulator